MIKLIGIQNRPQQAELLNNLVIIKLCINMTISGYAAQKMQYVPSINVDSTSVT